MNYEIKNTHLMTLLVKKRRSKLLVQALDTRKRKYTGRTKKKVTAVHSHVSNDRL